MLYSSMNASYITYSDSTNLISTKQSANQTTTQIQLKKDTLRYKELWFDPGLGFFTSDFSGISLYLSLSGVLKNNGLLSLRVISNSQLKFLDEPGQYITDIGVLYGYNFSNIPIDKFCISIGIGLVEGIKRGELIGCNFGCKYKSIQVSTIGIPFELELNIVDFRSGSLVANLFGNYNSELPVFRIKYLLSAWEIV